MDVTRIPLDTMTSGPGGKTNAYLVGSGDALLVDPALETAALGEAVRDADVGHVAVTHHHPDHVGAVDTYADECDATVWAHARHAEDFESATGRRPDRTFREGTAIPTGDGPIRVRETPGHAPEHVAFAWTDDGAVTRDGRLDRIDGAVVGDLAVAVGSVVVGAPSGDMRAYVTSLRRLLARDPGVLYPGHGPVIDDPCATLRRLLQHRLDRERRVLAAVRDGARDLDSILDAAYEKDLTGVRRMARATVVAHLEKLDVEGSLSWDGEHAEPA